MNRENSIIYLVSSPDSDSTFEELKDAFGAERAVDINMDLYMRTYSKIMDYKNAVLIIAYAKTRKYYDLRWLSYDEPGFLDISGRSYHDAFISTADLAFKTGARKVLWINHLCPFITSADIALAFSNINEKNIVIGPASNKGLYLVGFQRDAVDVFDDFYPFRDNLTDEVMERIKKNRYSVVEMKENILVKDEDSLKILSEGVKPDLKNSVLTDADNSAVYDNNIKHKKKHDRKDDSLNKTADSVELDLNKKN